MKKYRSLLLFLIVCLGYIGCEENEIALYNESPRINFLYSRYEYTFRDTDYVKGNELGALKMKVQLQGYLLQEARDFVLKAQDGKAYTTRAEVVLPEKYSYTAIDTNLQEFAFEVKRPKELTPKNRPAGVLLKFDLENPGHQFDPGRKDMDSCRIEVYYDITPTGASWVSYDWGEYSTGKYLFMMDFFGVAYKDMEYWRLDELKVAYEEYKQTNGPILDDNGKEITFPDSY